MTLIATRRQWNPIVLILAGLWFAFVFSGREVISRLLVHVDGTITSSRSGTGPRYSTWYSLQNGDGQTQEYVAGPTDSSLPRDIPPGTYIRKEKYDLCYTRDGHRVCDFPVRFYSIVFAIGVALLGFGGKTWWEQRKNP